jgi:hypothetical protein
VGSGRALLGANHRGKAWKPFQGFHISRVGSRRALLGANHRGKAWKPFQGFHISAFQSALPSEQRVRGPRIGEVCEDGRRLASR